MAQAIKERKKRSKYEIAHDILEHCQNGAKKTWVMYRANLSYDLTNNYLNYLMKLGLIENKDGMYYTTEKGKQLLEVLDKYVKLKVEVESLEKKIKELWPADIELPEEENNKPQENTSVGPQEEVPKQ